MRSLFFFHRAENQEAKNKGWCSGKMMPVESPFFLLHPALLNFNFMHDALGCKMVTSPTALWPHTQLKKRSKGQKAKRMLTRSVIFTNLFFFHSKIFVFISLPERADLCCMKRRSTGGWVSQPTHLHLTYGWNSFFRFLLSHGCLIFFWGFSETSGSFLSVQAIFYHLLYPAWCYIQKGLRTDWLEGCRRRVSEMGDVEKTQPMSKNTFLGSWNPTKARCMFGS